MHSQKEIQLHNKLEEKRGLNSVNIKRFIPLSNSRICSLHFSEDAYEPGHSPQFLEHIGCEETFRVRLKSDALPMLNKPLADASASKVKVIQLID